MQIQELMALIEAQVPALGVELQRAAAWVARNPRDAGLLSMRQQAAQAGVSPNSMARLAQALGYDGYGPFRQVFQDALGHGAPAYKERVRRLQGETASQFDDALLRTHLDNARSPTVANAPKDIARAVQRMRAARRLYFLGTRSCFAISYHFAYAYSMIAGNGVLVHGLGGTYPDQLDAAGPEDLLVCVTQNPYGRQTLEAARDCRQAGVPVLALTDSPLAPIQAHATQALLFDAGTPSYFHSMVGSLALVERLLAKLAAAGGEAAQQRIDAFERRLDASSAYFGGPSPTPRRGARKT
jgi:DNA-binding MurR/RpiR family transcriptional regulator